MSKSLKKDPNLLERSPSDMVRDFFNVGKVKHLFRVGSEIFSAAVPAFENPTSLNVAKSLFMVGKVIVDDMEVWPEDYFDERWESPYPFDFNKIILNALANKPYKIIRTSDESTIIHMVHVEDIRFGYVLNTRTNAVDKIYVEIEKIEAAKNYIKNELWQLMKDDNIVLRHVRRPSNSYDSSSISLDVDDAFHPMPSKRAKEYSSYLKKCVDADVSRSVLLYGPPGTGKSTMARTIINDLGMKSFRIRVEDIGHIETSTVFEAINIFEPDAVILDDFDRCVEQAALLETLEYFQRHVKLVIATVNNKNKLDEAILRPGRFDELVQIKQMDDDVVRIVLGEEHASSFELVKDWPIAFIQEYVKRLRFMTPEEAVAATKELAHRVQRLSKYDDDDSDNELKRVLREESEKSESCWSGEENPILAELMKKAVRSKKKARKHR